MLHFLTCKKKGMSMIMRLARHFLFEEVRSEILDNTNHQQVPCLLRHLYGLYGVVAQYLKELCEAQFIFPNSQRIKWKQKYFSQSMLQRTRNIFAFLPHFFISPLSIFRVSHYSLLSEPFLKAGQHKMDLVKSMLQRF